MPEWLTYQLSDLLLFSERVYWRLFELENAALWPLPVLSPLAVLAALLLYVRHRDIGRRVMCGLLAIAWVWVGWHFVLQRYAPINWAMTYASPLFTLQAIIFAILAMRRPSRDAIPRYSTFFGYGMILTGTLAYPALAVLQGRTVESAEIVGIAPDPTAIVSIGAAYLFSQGWIRLAALLGPSVWLAQSALTLYFLNGSAALAPALGLGFGLVVHMMLPGRHRSS